MTNSIADIIAAISAGQGLTSAGNRFAKSQVWQLALEEAHLQNEWVMRAPNPESGNQRGLSIAALDTQQPRPDSAPKLSRELRGDPTRQRAHYERGNTVAEPKSLPVKVSTTSGDSAQKLLGGVASVRSPSGQLPRVSPTQSVLPTPRVVPHPSAVQPRSVRLFSSHGHVHVVVRDEALKGSDFPRLVARIREVVFSFGERVSKIIVNGMDVWRDPMNQNPPSDDDGQQSIEILF
jgi:hypothetical protein